MNFELDPKATLYFFLRKTLVWLFLVSWLTLLVAGMRAPSEPHPGFSGLIGIGFLAAYVPVLAVVLILAWIACRLQARAYRITLIGAGVVLEYGVISKSHETLLYAKIQNILVERGLLERLMGLATVIIQNAMGQPETIPGLAAGSAADLRDAIIGRLPR
jgi:membrane protein YdbS with pleckstrin-like domain